MNAYRQIYEQFFEDASFLWGLRSIAVKQPHYTAEDLSQLEQRIEANLDGLMTSLEESWSICEAGLEQAQAGEVFVSAVVAFRSRDMNRIQRSVEVGLQLQSTMKGLISALGWIPDSLAHDWIKKFLHSKNLEHKYLAIRACSIRRENPGKWLNQMLEREDCISHTLLYNGCLRLIGELRRQDLADSLVDAVKHTEDVVPRFWALWSQVLLGQKTNLQLIEPYAVDEGPLQRHAMELLLGVLPIEQSHALISKLANVRSLQREVIMGSGILGDPHAVNWLIGRMADPVIARVAGEAFSAITGIDLEQQELSSEPPAGFPLQPNNDPDDDDVDLDEDENLPWPDAEKIKAFWETHGSKFVSGQRYFYGRPVNVATLKEMLPSLNMRQRHRAALEIALTDASEPYINTQAKTDDQRK